MLVNQARIADPSVEEGPGLILARLAVAALVDEPGLSAVDLARRLVAEHPEADPSWVNVIALEASRLLRG